jgi:phosphoribosylamine--glycine ligase
LNETELKIIKPVIEGLKKEGKKFNGCLYAGLMITKTGPKVVEFNCRFGDPETQAVLPLLSGDFLELLYSSAAGKINKSSVAYNGGSAVCVVASSKGYPGAYEKGKAISGLDEIEDKNILVFHAGTQKNNNKIITSGGRVLSVVSTISSNDLSLAKEKAYEAMEKINFEGKYFRNDIADKGINRKQSS